MRLSLLSAIVVAFALAISARAEEPFLRKDDVIALVGGEDMVAAAEYGYLELLLTRALPEHRLKFRCLAWEGDTVFEQPRQLNYPKLEQQLDEIGATVVICQFGQMESLAGKGSAGDPPAGSGNLPDPSVAGFIASYEKLIARLSAGGKRRMVLSQPSPVVDRDLKRDIEAYRSAIHRVAGTPIPGLQASPPMRARVVEGAELYQRAEKYDLLRDGLHLSASGHKELAYLVGHETDAPVEDYNRVLGTGLEPNRNRELTTMLNLIRAKNRLWFDYWRPQNWAFLAGDRTTQASSRDHLDPSKRWFPAEREEFLPLIAQKEQEIWGLAAPLK